MNQLVLRDPVLAGILDRFGPPPTWHREPGLASLIHIMLEQQVSLASARITFDRLGAVAGALTPSNLLALDDAQLRGAGVSRQKARYVRALALSVASGDLDLGGLDQLDDTAVDAALQAVPGIGRWTSSIYRMSALRRPDTWPTGDLAVAVAIADLWSLPAPPNAADAETFAERWRPWRADAARLLWHHYLSAPIRRTRPPRAAVAE